MSVAYADLRADVGFFLGHGRGVDFGDPVWTVQQEAAINRCVKGGLRKFYHCGYDWSFLRPVATLNLASGSRTVEMPDDFGGLEEQVVVADVSGRRSCALFLTSVSHVRQMETRHPDTSGLPSLCALEPLKDMPPNEGQRHVLRFWPKADQNYQVLVQYYVNPDFLSGTAPYAYGGPQHAQTLLEACLSEAELLLDDTAGVHAAEFQRLLTVSMDIDRRNKPMNLGYNGDRSDWTAHDRFMNWRRPAVVTWEGVSYP